MNEKAMSLVELRKAGMKALLERLRPVGMIRFLQQVETGQGDYSTERHALLAGRDVETIAEQIRRSRLQEEISPGP